MYKNQLQELAQRSCFNLPCYACIREGPDHAPRFKASVNFNGEVFEGPSYCSTLRQAEHAAAEVALSVLSSKGPSISLTARVLDETGVYKNLLQETAHRAGLNLPVYTTVRSGPGHVPVFTCTVELAGMSFTGEPAKTKKQAEKNAAIAAWSALKTIPEMGSALLRPEEHEQVMVARVLSNLRPEKDQVQSQRRRMVMRGHSLVDQKWRLLDLPTCSSSRTQKQSSSFVSLVPPPPPPTASKILPLPPNRSDQKALEEHLRDEEEWLGLKKKKMVPIEKESNPRLYRPFSDQTQIRNMLMRSLNQNPSPISPPPPRMFRFSNNPHAKIAPAVQIRSVIPVCAAPVRAPPDPSSKLKEVSTSAGGATEVSVSKFSNKAQLQSKSELTSSEFNSKLQL